MNIVAHNHAFGEHLSSKMYLELENNDINAVTHSMLENGDIPLSKLEYILNRFVGKGHCGMSWSKKVKTLCWTAIGII